MESFSIVRFSHLLLAFVYVASLFAAHWNLLAARRTENWSERALLFEMNRRNALVFGFLPLLLIGVLGNVLAMQLGYRMATTPTFRIVNGVWLVAVLVAALLDLPATSRLAVRARAAASNGGGEPVEWKSLLGRWRLGNSLQLVLFIVLLYFMVAPWRHT